MRPFSTRSAARGMRRISPCSRPRREEAPRGVASVAAFRTSMDRGIRTEASRVLGPRSSVLGRDCGDGLSDGFALFGLSSHIRHGAILLIFLSVEFEHL